MTQTFELIEVQTSALRDAYEPTMFHLQELLPKSLEKMKEIHAYADLIQTNGSSQWHKDMRKYQEYEEELWEYFQKKENLWNRICRKKFTRPILVLHPGGLCSQLWYTNSWDLKHRTENLVRLLFKECNEALFPCEYSDKVQMTYEQLKRVEYFRSGRALKDALEWLDKKLEQF